MKKSNLKFNISLIQMKIKAKTEKLGQIEQRKFIKLKLKLTTSE